MLLNKQKKYFLLQKVAIVWRLFFLSAITPESILHAQQAPAIEWEKCFGGSNSSDEAFSIHQLKNKGEGYVVAGSAGLGSDGDVTGNHGSYDFWIVRLNNEGNMVWENSYGGSLEEIPYSIQETSDSGFVIAGVSRSNDGDVSVNHNDSYGNASVDFWIIKIDVNGTLIWQKSFGGSGYDFAKSIQLTADGGYVAAGYSNSTDGDVSGNHGGSDYWILKLNSSGNIVWEKSYGGSEDDEATSIIQNADGGFVVAGFSSSNDGDVTGNHGSFDYWVIKLDGNGTLVWEKSFGGSDDDEANAISYTTDGGFIIAGLTMSINGDVSGDHLAYGSGTDDYWIVDIDSTGNLIWQKCLGGTLSDVATCIVETAGGMFVAGGLSISSDGDISSIHGWWDYWLVELNNQGNIIWQKNFGGSDDDKQTALQQTSDEGFIIAGYTESLDGDVTGCHGPVEDYWIVKLAPDTLTGIGSIATNSISIFPNPVQSQLTINLPTPANEVSIRVHDVQGREIALPATFAGTQAQLNTENLSPGFYILQLINNKTGEIEVGKFVKAE